MGRMTEIAMWKEVDSHDLTGDGFSATGFG